MKKRETVKANKVKEPKVKFALTIKGEWDFNRDLAGNDCNDSSLSRFMVRHEKNFKEAFQTIIADMIFDRCSNAFETVGLSMLECSPECENSFQELKSRLSDSEKKKAQEELASLERRTKELKAKLKGK